MAELIKAQNIINQVLRQPAVPKQASNAPCNQTPCASSRQTVNAGTQLRFGSACAHPYSLWMLVLGCQAAEAASGSGLSASTGLPWYGHGALCVTLGPICRHRCGCDERPGIHQVSFLVICFTHAGVLLSLTLFALVAWHPDTSYQAGALEAYVSSLLALHSSKQSLLVALVVLCMEAQSWASAPLV